MSYISVDILWNTTDFTHSSILYSRVQNLESTNKNWFYSIAIENKYNQWCTDLLI